MVLEGGPRRWRAAYYIQPNGKVQWHSQAGLRLATGVVEGANHMLGKRVPLQQAHCCGL